MVLLESQERLAEAIDAQRRARSRQEREWRPNSAAGRAMPFEHWTEFAKDLNTSYTNLTADEDFLRRGQRRQWRKDEQEILKENRALRVETLRSLIAFRGDETAERKAGIAIVHPSLGNKLAQQYASFELGQRSKRRTRRERLEAESPRWPRPSSAQRPSTAPAVADAGRQPQPTGQQRPWNAGPGRSAKDAQLRRGWPLRKPTHGRAPPPDAAIWRELSNGDLWSVSGSRAPGLPSGAAHQQQPRQAWT